MTERRSPCPSCSQPGNPVGRITLKALLTADGLRRGLPAQPQYCDNADCPIIYFGTAGELSFTESELVVRVYAKQPNDPATPVCYCFDVTVGAMASDRARELRESVALEVQAGHCACEVKNPKGACCLGDLVRLERGTGADKAASCCTS